MLSERQKKIVDLLLKHPSGINANEISKEVHVSSRTIRNDIASINVSLMNAHCMINASKRIGYFITKDSVEKVKECITLMNAIDHKQIASSPMERKYYVLGQVIANGCCDIYELEEELYVSQQTLYKDITSFQKYLQDTYHFENLLFENGKIQLINDEVELRTLFYRIVKEEIYMSNKLVDIHLYQLIKSHMDIEEIYDIVDYLIGYCKTNDIKIPDQVLFIISWMILFSVVRCEQGHYVTIPIALQHKNEELQKMLHTLCSDLHYEIRLEDMSLLQNYMETLGLFGTQDSLIQTSNEDILHEFVAVMKHKYELDFESMPSLFENFKSHLEFAIKRLLMDYQLINPLLQEVKTTYAFAYEIAMMIVPIVHKKYNLYMKEDEISFLALYIQPFLKVQDTSVNIMIVYGTTQSYASFIETWVLQEFKERVQIVSIVPLSQMEVELKQHNVDLIISNTSIDTSSKVDIIEISQLPYEADRVKIENFISRQAMLSQSVSILHEVFSKDRICILYEDQSFESVIKQSCELLQQQHKIEDANTFMEGIISREIVYPTRIDHGCYMPHPLMNNAKENSIVLTLLKGNVCKDGQDVRLVFVCAFEPKINSDLKYIYNLINMCATNERLLDMIMELKTPEEIMTYLEKMIQIVKL